jgi:uncharacterized protein YndB with AHSA1/START domain
MTAPDVPLSMEVSFEFAATPEQLWDAVATANGIRSWFLRTDLEEREGGTIVIHMGQDVSSTGKVTGWDPPRRFAYEEPDWAAVTGQEGATVSPLLTEFLVEARSGGTCVVRVVSSAFGTGAEWEREFFDNMEKGWAPFFDNLRLYLADFQGQRVTSLSAQVTVPGDGAKVRAAMRQALGAEEVGEPVTARGIAGRIQRVDDDGLIVRLTDPVPGYMMFAAMDQGNGSTWTQIEGYLYSEDAPAYVERAQPAWKEWLQNLATPAV